MSQKPNAITVLALDRNS